MQDGYILLPRSILQEYFWTSKSSLTTKVFLYLVLNAAHKDCRLPSGIEIKQGQVATSSRKLGAELGISRNTLKDILYNLEHTHQVTLEHTHRQTIVNICDYNRFQYYQERNTPTNTPTNTSRMGQLVSKSGSTIEPPNKTINNKETNVGSFEKSEVQNDEIPWLRDTYPFHNREGLKQHLMARNYTEHEASLFMEKFYVEYTGKKEALV